MVGKLKKKNRTAPPNHCSHCRYLYLGGTQKRTLAALKVALPGLGSYLRGNRSLLTAHRAPCAENAIINVKVIGASQEMSNYLPLPSKSCQWLKGGAGRSETLEHRRSPTNISKRLRSSENNMDCIYMTPLHCPFALSLF